MIPKIICFLFGHEKRFKAYHPEDNIGKTPGEDGVYIWTNYSNCPRCGRLLAKGEL